MAMHGGISHTHNASGYRNDTWALAFPGLRWLGPANYSGGEAGAAFPSARRAHSLASYLVGGWAVCLSACVAGRQAGLLCESSSGALRALMHPGSAPCTAGYSSPSSYLLQDEDGSRFLLLFGGRRSDGLLLNDVWQGRLEEGKGGSLRVAWTLLHDPQTSTGTGAVETTAGGRAVSPFSGVCCLMSPTPLPHARPSLSLAAAAGPAPLPRSGHVAVMNGSSSLILHGGRSEVYGSFADVWSFDLASKRWTPLPPATAVQPAARDFHGGALWNGRLFIYGGRFGELRGHWWLRC